LTSIKITVDLGSVTDMLDSDKIIKAAVEEAQKGGETIMNEAKGNVHVVSGDLKASGNTKKLDKGIEGSFTKDYAEIEENRTGGKYPGSHAYLKPAIEHNEDIIAKNIERKIQEAIR
jgi:sulfur transfer complex TusBCD TusB component (DsrH family)